MDTFRLKFDYLLPQNSPYFKERVQTKDLNLLDNRGNRFVYTNNSWRKEIQKSGIYVPKYWIEEGYLHPEKKYFTIESSVGKLINQESATEIKTSDLDKVIVALQKFFKEIGVTIFTTQILNAIPIVFAVGKNISLTKRCSCDLALKVLENFDERFRSSQRIIFFENAGGKEIYFNNKASTFKVYSKIPEICNNAVTEKELEIKKSYEQKKYNSDQAIVIELLRFELTLKSKQSVKQRAGQYINGEPTFEKLFNEDIWFDMLKNEVSRIYNPSIKDFIFLSINNKPIIDAYLDKNIKCLRIKAMITYFLINLQEKGFKKMKADFLKEYSKKTWYNYMNILRDLEKRIDFSSLKNNQQIDVLYHILNEFDIETKIQEKLL